MYALVIVVVVVVASAEEVEMLAAAIALVVDVDVAADAVMEVAVRHTGLCCWRDLALVAVVIAVIFIVIVVTATLKDDPSTMHALFASKQCSNRPVLLLLSINSMQPSISAT